ncbi:MAG: ATP-dependent helicase, partial [Anaerorhabdus sp.]
PDQTIYTWRGAEVDIIINFDKIYPDTHTIFLNENYRSNNIILSSANSLIMNNTNRIEKDLFTSRKSNELITHYVASSAQKEAMWIADKISELHRDNIAYKEIAVLYRSNFLSRLIEKAVINNGIPYVIYGGIKFYERAEIKDALSYLKVIFNKDDLAFMRIINKPRRGIGERSLDKIFELSQKYDIKMIDVLAKDEVKLISKANREAEKFLNLFNKYYLEKDSISIEALLMNILKDSGYFKMLEDDTEDERIANIMSLVEDIKEFEKHSPTGTLDEYLQMVALYTDIQSKEVPDCIKLMTVHSAKGLEFDTVFILGMSEDLFPNGRSLKDGIDALEEERRLAYVAITRAKNRLFLTENNEYNYIGKTTNRSSRFIYEIGSEFLNEISDEVINYSIKKERNYNDISHDKNFKKKDAEESSVFRKGEIVEHTKFGQGLVIEYKHGFVSVAFKHPTGIRKIKADHPSISKVKK